MVIARVIADIDDLETRMQELRDGIILGAEFTVDVGPSSVRLLDLEVPVVEMHFPFEQHRLAFNIIDAHFGKCDAVVSESDFAVPQLFVSDMDSTMIGQECIDELADYAGLKDKIAEITERAMQGELDFESALRERVGLLAGLDESAIDRCLAERIKPTLGAETLVRTLKAKGTRCVLVTGGFHHFGDRVAEWLGFDRVVGNRLAVADGKLTGELDGPISDASTKLAVLQEEAAKLGEDAVVLSSGDGANDIPILEAATYGFAYRAKPKAREAANGRTDHGDLTAILSLLGIPREEWVTG